MKTKFIEVTNGNQNWGKFMLLRFDSEFEYASQMAPGSRLLSSIGWAPEHLIVFDLQTCEGAAFRPGGSAKYDLEKHRVWVCPMFEPFLEWLYKQDLSDLAKLPGVLDLPDAEFAMYGYRRDGVPLIGSTPGVCGGEPCILGTRISVRLIWQYHKIGTDMKTMIDGWPHLREDQIEAAIEYAKAHSELQQDDELQQDEDE